MQLLPSHFRRLAAPGRWALVALLAGLAGCTLPKKPDAPAERVALVMDGRVERIGPPTEVMAYARIRMAEASRAAARPLAG